MSLVKKVSDRFSASELHLKDASKFLRDCGVYVKSRIVKFGVAEFEYASDRLKSDVEFLLDMVTVYPNILKYSFPIVHERYKDEGNDMDYFAVSNLCFAIECFKRSPASFRFMHENMAKDFYRYVKKGEIYNDHFMGRDVSYSPSGNDDVWLLTELRPEIVEAVDKENLERVGD